MPAGVRPCGSLAPVPWLILVADSRVLPLALPAALAASHSTARTSDSVVASLCREVDAIRQRSRVLTQAMARCQNGGLLQRLRRDLAQMQARRRELLATARAWQRRGAADPLGMAFLIEMCSRPLPC